MADLSDPHPIPPEARCVSCGYSLYQLETDRCPECAREFDRRDPKSMGIRRSRIGAFIIDRLNRRTSRITKAIPWAATALLAWGNGFLWLYPIAILLGLTLWMLFLIGHVPLMVVRRLVVNRINPPILNSDIRVAWIAAATGLITVAACYVPISAFVYFLIYRGKFDHLANQVPPAPENYGDFPGSRIGPCELSVSRFPHFVSFSGMPPYHNYYTPISARPGVQFIRLDPGQTPPSDAVLWHVAKDWYITQPQWPGYPEGFRT